MHAMAKCKRGGEYLRVSESAVAFGIITRRSGFSLTSAVLRSVRLKPDLRHAEQACYLKSGAKPRCDVSEFLRIQLRFGAQL